MKKPVEKRTGTLVETRGSGDYAKVLAGVTELLEAARRASARVVNTLTTATYWEIGRRIVESNGKSRAWGVFSDVNAAVTAAVDAQREFEARGLEERRKAIQCIRKICSEQADELGRAELEETAQDAPCDGVRGEKFLRLAAIRDEDAVHRFGRELAEEPAEFFAQVQVGLDLGLKSMVITSDGHTYGNPKFFAKQESPLVRVGVPWVYPWGGCQLAVSRDGGLFKFH